MSTFPSPSENLSLNEEVYFGIKLIGITETIYGLLLIMFIIFLPAGIYGSIRDALFRRRPARSSGGVAVRAPS